MTSEELDNIRAKWTATDRTAVAYMGDHETFYAELRDAESWHLVAKVDIDGGGTGEDGRALADAYTDVPRLCDEVARLTAEVERLSAMVPRWSFDAPGRGELMMGECRIGSVVRMSPGDWSAWATDVDGTAWQYVCRAQTAESACAAVCTRLGMPYISPPTENT